MITHIRDFTTTPLPIPKNFLVVYLLNLSSECLVSYDPHFPGNDGTNKVFGSYSFFLGIDIFFDENPISYSKSFSKISTFLLENKILKSYRY